MVDVLIFVYSASAMKEITLVLVTVEQNFIQIAMTALVYVIMKFNGNGI